MTAFTQTSDVIPGAPGGTLTIGTTHITMAVRGPASEHAFAQALASMCLNRSFERRDVAAWCDEAIQHFQSGSEEPWLRVLEEETWSVPGIGNLFLSVGVGSLGDALVGACTVGVTDPGYRGLMRDFPNRHEAEEYVESLLALYEAARGQSRDVERVTGVTFH